MHFKLLKSDNICSFYTNLNIEKYAVVLGGKPITNDRGISDYAYVNFQQPADGKNFKEIYCETLL
jgi:hypothetical protein